MRWVCFIGREEGRDSEGEEREEERGRDFFFDFGFVIFWKLE